MPKHFETEDLYDILGVDRDATHDEIKKAYRDLAMKYHPDRNQDDKAAEDMFKKVSEAYATIGDPEAREQYNKTGQRTTINRLETKALELVGGTFAQLMARHGESIVSIDVIAEMGDLFHAQLPGFEGIIEDQGRKHKFLDKIKKRIKCKGPADVMTRCITQEQESCAQKKLDAEFQITAFTRALEMLEDFTFKFQGGISSYKVTDRRRVTGAKLRLGDEW